MKRVIGYTLLEVLIALAISGVLLAILSQTLGELQQAFRRARESDQSIEATAAGRRMVAGLLVGALPGLADDAEGGLTGEPDGVSFVASPPAALATLGLLRVRLFVASTGAGQVGLYAAARTVAHDTFETTLRPTLLVGGLQWARFAYAAAPAASLRDRWPPQSRRLPAIVQLRWQRAGTAEELQPVLVAPRRTLAGGCRFDPISLVCRGAE